MKIAVAFPTRTRPDTFLKMLDDYVQSSGNPDNVHYIVVHDDDDVTMTPGVLALARQSTKNITFVGGLSMNKIHACNRGIREYKCDWDILVLASDDMMPVAVNWHEVIIETMKVAYPDTDGCVWFSDGHQDRICTMSIIGRKYYERFGYIYHPSYISLWCDNEFTEVAMLLNRMSRHREVLFKHLHPMWTGEHSKMDALYHANEAYFKTDRANYTRRKATNFEK
jgi:hypothetical protein